MKYCLHWATLFSIFLLILRFHFLNYRVCWSNLNLPFKNTIFRQTREGEFSFQNYSNVRLAQIWTTDPRLLSEKYSLISYKTYPCIASTRLCLASCKNYINKQWRPRWDAAKCGNSSGSALIVKCLILVILSNTCASTRDSGNNRICAIVYNKRTSWRTKKTLGLNSGLSLHLHPCFVCASSEGSGESAYMHRLTWTTVVHRCKRPKSCALSYK